MTSLGPVCAENKQTHVVKMLNEYIMIFWGEGFFGCCFCGFDCFSFVLFLFMLFWRGERSVNVKIHGAADSTEKPQELGMCGDELPLSQIRP